jgi:hypothetical protein
MNTLAKGSIEVQSRTGVKHLSPYSSAKKHWTHRVGIFARQAKLEPVSSAYFTFVHQRQNRQVDPDNFCGPAQKLALDGLQKARIIVNDGWSQVRGLAHFWVTAETEGVWVILSDSPLSESEALACAGVRKVA